MTVVYFVSWQLATWHSAYGNWTISHFRATNAAIAQRRTGTFWLVSHIVLAGSNGRWCRRAGRRHVYHFIAVFFFPGICQHQTTEGIQLVGVDLLLSDAMEWLLPQNPLSVLLADRIQSTRPSTRHSHVKCYIIFIFRSAADGEWMPFKFRHIRYVNIDVIASVELEIAWSFNLQFDDLNWNSCAII